MGIINLKRSPKDQRLQKCFFIHIIYSLAAHISGENSYGYFLDTGNVATKKRLFLIITNFDPANYFQVILWSGVIILANRCRCSGGLHPLPPKHM